MLKISTAKVAHAIARAREHDAIAGSWEQQIQRSFYEELDHTILDTFQGDTVHGRLAEFIATLTRDEKASLLAIALIGKGRYTPQNLAGAVESARSEALFMQDSYLIGIPLLADYLREGMEKLGLSIPDREEKGPLQ
jgi:Protein of unknown function (DUF3775)